jgi:hypothetical protein
MYIRAPTTLKSEGEVTSLSGADKREIYLFNHLKQQIKKNIQSK